MAVSDIITSPTNQNHQSIFTERNGYRFQYVLDYMRDGSITLDCLPNHIHKEALYKDLEYFGFVGYRTIKIPNEIKYIHGIQHHQIVWDTKRAASGLILEKQNTVVTHTDMRSTKWQGVFGTIGYTTGIHYWCWGNQCDCGSTNYNGGSKIVYGTQRYSGECSNT
jgi:BTB/POZ domain